jgi:hypothetical protein
MNFIFKLLRAGIKNCFEELKISINEPYPKFNNFRSRFNYLLYLYFLPITATWRGLKIAWAEKFDL